MLNLFGKRKNTESKLLTNISGAVNNIYSMRIALNGEILEVQAGVKECLTSKNILDATQVLPKNLKQFCRSIAKSKASQIKKCQYSSNIWIWEFVLLDDKTIHATLLNHEVFSQLKSDASAKDNIQSNYDLFDNVPISICVTKKNDTYEVISANKKFHEIFTIKNDELKSLQSLIDNKEVLADIQTSLKDNDSVEGVLFVYTQSGKSFWENCDRYFSIRVQRFNQGNDDTLVWIFDDVSDFKKLQDHHQLYKKKFNTAIQAATEGIWEWSKLDEYGDWWSKPMYSLLGLGVETNKPSLEILKRLMHPKEKKLFDRLLEKEILLKKYFSMDCRLTVKGQGFKWFRLRVVGTLDSDGELNKLIGSLVDIHAEKTNRKQLQLEKDKAVATLNSIVDAVITTNADGVVEYLNSAAERLTGIYKDQAKGESIEKVTSFYREHSQKRIYNPVTECLNTGECMNQKIYADMLDKDSNRYTVQVMATPLSHKDGQIYGVVLVLNDVTNIRTLSRRLKYQASHDILTKLINRSEFERRVYNAITHAKTNDINSTVLYVDLDRFKLINDICGHAAGDELLKQVAKLIRSIVSDDSSVARMGGDEFAVLIENTNIDDAEKVAKLILRELSAYRFSWDDKTFTVECSIGIAEIQSSCQSLAYILNAVDRACYLAKESGRNCIRKYSDGDDTIIERKGQEFWIQHFDKAIENDDLVLYAQPIFPLSKQSDNKTSFEILVRMIDEEGNIIPPNAFLPAVERFDRAYKLDRWVIESVFSYISLHKKQLDKITKISINLSGQSVAEDELLSFIQDKSIEYKIDTTKICFEITETAAIANLTTAIDLIEQLKQDGFLFALDDFGSGLSSFAYLKTLSVDYLKIDGIFVKDIQTDKVNYAMVKAIHEMSAVLDKKTIAEYVENEAVVELLTEIGVDYAQGFHLGKPAPIENYISEVSLKKRVANSAA